MGLWTIGGAVVVNESGVPIDCEECPCGGCDGCFVAVYIGNENAITDDDFEVYLDEVLIATLDDETFDAECEPTTCRGALILPASLTGWQPTITGLGGVSLDFCDGEPIDLIYIYSAALDDVANGFHEIELRSITDNGCGNYGRLRIYCVNNPTGEPEDASLDSPVFLDEDYYTMGTSGSSFFGFTSDCPE